MKDLERATGVGREAIRFYIREGLLPEPERPAKNVAWYDPSFVERILFIKELQEKRYLPLHVIRKIVGDDAEPSRAEVDALLELDGRLFPQIGTSPRPSTREKVVEVARRLDVPEGEIRRFAEAGGIEIASGDGEEWLEEDSIALLELWAELRRVGFTSERGFDPEYLGLYISVIEWLAPRELRLFARGITGRVQGEEAVRMAERGIDLMNEIVGLLRKRKLLQLIAEGNVPSVDDADGPGRPARERPRGSGADARTRSP